jgi:hypothetical protein
MTSGINCELLTYQQNMSANKTLPQWITLATAPGASKKAAKIEAARLAIDLLVPGLTLFVFVLNCFIVKGIPWLSKTTNALTKSATDVHESRIGDANDDDDSLALFDNIPLNDDRVIKLCDTTNQLSPHHLLQV